MSHPPPALVAALRRLPDERLEALLATHHELTARPPATFEDLAARVCQPHLLQEALGQLDRTAVQVAAVLGAAGGRGDAATICALLSRTAPVPDDVVVAALQRCAALGVVWPAAWEAQGDPPRGAGVHWECARAMQVLGVDRLLPFPPLRALAEGLPMQELREVVRHLRLGAVRSRFEALVTLEEAFADQEWLRAVLDAGPAGAAAVLAAAVSGRADGGAGTDGWLRERLLLVTDSTGATTVCREVATAFLAGRVVTSVALPPAGGAPGRTDTAGPVRAALALVEQIRALLESVAGTPLVCLQSGGIGVRELRRLGRLLALDESRTAWLLDVAGLAGLLTSGPGAGRPTRTADAWSALDDVDAYLGIVTAVLQAGPRPLLPADTFSFDLFAPLCGWRANIALRRLGDVARACLERGEADVEALDWQWAVELPVLVRQLLLRERLLQLDLLGLLGEGPPPWLRPLLDGDPVAAAEAFRACLDPEQDTAVWQADATAFVAGRPSGTLRTTLAAVAVRESERTWRLSAERVRDSLDAGQDDDRLLAALRTGSAYDLPTTVQQAVRDVARRHGQIRVVPATTLLRVADRALGELVVRDRRLAGLQLTLVEDTVLASPKPVAEVLAALRKAGHAPVGPPQPAATKPAAGPVPTPPRQASAADAVARLRASRPGPVPAQRGLPGLTVAEPSLGDDLDTLQGRLRHLPPAQAELLLAAIVDGSPVEIDYVDQRGRRTTRVIEDLAPDDGLVVAYCSLRDDERVFSPAGIRAARAGV